LTRLLVVAASGGLPAVGTAQGPWVAPASPPRRHVVVPAAIPALTRLGPEA